MPIHVLDENTINKIAAGEVVDRPSSIVKELVENAIDAGSSAITVEIKDGGISLIRITDNGCGIPMEEVRLAFCAHATSKIKDAADLVSITSLGFRGEALSSICAVAQVELITKIDSSLTGTRYEIEGGVERTCEQVGAPNGTTFLVRNLFFNTPARRKFLKSATTEAGYISSLMEHLAMSHPEISFRFIQNGQAKLQTVGNGELKDVIYAIYGREITNNLLPIHYQDESVSIDGFIGKPLVSRGNRTFENYYINSRFVKSNVIMKAIEDAYAPYIMMHKYPFTAFKIEIAPELIDVNVHPSKMELRFADNIGIYNVVKEAIEASLAHKELIPQVELSNQTTPVVEAPKVSAAPLYVSKTIAESSKLPGDVSKPPVDTSKTPADVSRSLIDAPKVSSTESDTMPSQNVSATESTTDAMNKQTSESNAEASRSIFNTRMPEPFEVKRTIDYQETFRKESEKIKSEQMTLFEKSDLLEEKHEKDIRIVGQVFDTYWIMEYEKNMYIVDQHAAHEKVKFERFMKAYLERKICTQQISPPIILSLTLQEQQTLLSNMDYFTEFGFEIEEFGGDEYAVRGIPADFSQADPSELLMEILDSMGDDVRRSTPESIKDRIATMSCKAAVKGGNHLRYAEMQELLHELMTLDNPYNCPHGRPTMITMSQYELEKKFKRIV